MAGHGFASLSIEALASFLTALSSDEWAKDDIKELLANKQLPDDTKDPGVFVLLKLDMHQSISALLQQVGSDISVVLKNIDTELDTLEDRLQLRVNLAKLEGAAEQKEAARRCDEKLVIPGITKMSYKDEIANARLQVKLATQDPIAGERALRDDVALLGISDLIEQIGNKAEEFAITYKQSERSPSLRIQESLRDCGRALNNAYETLERLAQYASPQGALSQSIAQRLEALNRLRTSVSAPRPSPAPQSNNANEPGKD